MTEISSKENPSIKFIHKLMLSPKHRRKEKLFLVEGIRLCEEALKSKSPVTKVFYTAKCYEKSKELIENLIYQNKAESYIISDKLMDFLSDTETPQGIMCVCKIIDKKVNIDKIKACSKIVLLENIQNPSNLGSILRSLNAFGIQLVILSSDSCDLYNSKVLRGSMGAIFNLDIVVSSNVVNSLELLKKQGFTICATVPDNSAEPVTILNEIQKTVVIMGNEGNGISKNVISFCDKKITIPMLGRCESLNVAVATGIISWEMMSKGSFK